MKKTRILQVTGGLGIGGIEKIVVSFLEQLNPEKYQVDFLVYGNNSVNLADKVISLGGKVLYVPSPSNGYWKFYKEVVKKIKENGPYDIVHSHVLFNSGIIMRAAYQCGVEMRIAHSHDNLSYVRDNFVRKIYIKLMKKWLLKYSTKFCACSSNAGDYLFGKELFKEKGMIIPNAINIDKFEFSEGKRNLTRKKLNLKDKIVIGNIGRLEKQKNQKFLLNILLKMKKNENIKLVLVGDGSLKNDLENQIKELNLEDSVLMLGNREDICELLCAMDVFVLPSIHEGLGIVLIEAQANGLACVAPKRIVPFEAEILDNFIFTEEPKEENIDKWIEEIANSIKKGRKSNVKDKIKEAGYDYNTLGDRLEKIYKNDKI